MITHIPTFNEHMMSLQKDQKEALSDALESLLRLNLISAQEKADGASAIAIALNERIVTLGHRLQDMTDLNQKLDLLSVILMMMSAINLLNAIIAKDTKADTRRINAILYMR